MPNLNELTLDELAALGAQIATLVTAGKSLEAGRLGPVFDLTPGAPISIYTNAVMPAMDGGVTLTPLAADIVTRTSTRDLTRCDPELSAHLRKEAVDYASILFPESTEAPSDAPDAEPVEPPPAPGEVVGGGAPAVDQPGPPAGAEISAEPSRSDEASPSVEAEAESGGGVEVAAPEAPAATDADAKAEKWTQTEDAALVHLIVQGIMDEGLSRRAAIISAARQIGRPEPGTLWRVSKILKGKLDDALTAAAFEQAQTEAPEIPVTETEGKAVVSEDAAAGGHSPAAVQEVDAATLNATFDRQVDAMPDLHGEDLRVWQWVAAHRAKWPHTAGTDLDLAVGLGRGEKINLIALDTGIDAKKLQERWECLSRPIRNAQDKITLDGMPRLINILRRIAKAPAAAA